MTPAEARRARKSSGLRVRLKPHDSFDLIRLLARSQSDARKAVGELVQNSLDAQAERVDITWLTERGVRCLRILDDGEGIFPALGRQEALCRLAQTIGHSHKQDLSPAQRHQQLVLGKYGIGLLGFWCVAAAMEIKSRVGGGETWMLRLEEDKAQAEVNRARSRSVDEPATFTEITLRGVKDPVQRQVRPARLQAYLAGELRGQLLQRGVTVLLHDRVARGRAQKQFVVKPRAYLGRPLADLSSLSVPGHEDARVELYGVPRDEGRRGVVALACGGATVLDDIALVDPTDPGGNLREPWASGHFEGVIDFPDLQVAPGTRRGFVPDDAALDFLLALEKLEEELRRRLAQEERLKADERREQVVREIRRAFAPLARRLPQYDLFDVRAERRDAGTGSRGAGGNTGFGAQAPAAPEGALAPACDMPDESVELSEEPRAQDSESLYPPGPLADVQVLPARLRLAPAEERKLRARAVDADGRTVDGDVAFTWELDGPGALEADGARARYRAPSDPCTAAIRVRALQSDAEGQAEVAVTVREDAGVSGRQAGIPEPAAVDAPSEPWRSRMRGMTWEFNAGHPDYRAAAEDESRRVRYLIHLFAKEVVLRNFGGAPSDAEVLERMVEVLTHLGDARAR
jgi:hypothetical protein